MLETSKHGEETLSQCHCSSPLNLTMTILEQNARIYNENVRFGGFIVVIMKNIVFWRVKPRGSCNN
jgi:hypothetical protein